MLALSRADLAAAWRDVQANDAEDGLVATSISQFAEDADARLDRLAAALADGNYRPDPLLQIHIPKQNGMRTLSIPSVPDRVVERALLEALTPLIDPWLGPAAFAYRPGLGVADAVQALARLRDEGFSHVVRTDVNDCFPSVPVPLALHMLSALAPPAHHALAKQLLSRTVRNPRGATVDSPGLPQGCAVSPMLANLVLTQLDARLLREGFPLIRYADDIAIPVHGIHEGQEALGMCADTLHGLEMRLGADKTRIMSFREGFAFLGESFGTRYPPALAGHRVQAPDRRVMYVAHQGSRIRTKSGRLLVESPEDVPMLDVPTSQVARIVCFGSIGVSAGARTWAFTHDVDIVFASRSGSYLGQQRPRAPHSRADRLKAQIEVAEDPRRAVPIARAIVEAKLAKQATLLLKFNRREDAEQIRTASTEIESLQRLLPECTSRSELMGLEGAAAKAYFPALGALLPEEMRFTTRSRRPPLDLANAVLSYLYAVTLGECETAAWSAGLDPALGILHSPDPNRPSLALDLLEELRPLVVDQILVAGARRREIRPEHARTEPPRSGVLLTRDGKESVIRQYEYRMLQTTRGALPGFAGSLRRHIYRQAQRLAAAITTGQNWTGLSWR